MHAQRLPNTPRHPAQHSLCPCPGCPRPVPFPRDHAERFSAGPSATRTWGQQSIRSASSSPTVSMLAGPTLRRRSLWSREASYRVGGPSDLGRAVIGTPLVQDGRFRIPTRRFRNLSAGWRMAVQLMESVCLENGQRGVRVSADGDDEAGGKGELFGGAEEEGGTRGDAVGPVVAAAVAAAVASVMVRSGIVRGPVGSGDVVSALVPSSLVASSTVVFPATNGSSDAIGFARRTVGLPGAFRKRFPSGVYPGPRPMRARPRMLHPRAPEPAQALGERVPERRPRRAARGTPRGRTRAGTPAPPTKRASA